MFYKMDPPVCRKRKTRNAAKNNAKTFSIQNPLNQNQKTVSFKKPDGNSSDKLSTAQMPSSSVSIKEEVMTVEEPSDGYPTIEISSLTTISQEEFYSQNLSSEYDSVQVPINNIEQEVLSSEESNIETNSFEEEVSFVDISKLNTIRSYNIKEESIIKMESSDDDFETIEMSSDSF